MSHHGSRPLRHGPGCEQRAQHFPVGPGIVGQLPVQALDQIHALPTPEQRLKRPDNQAHRPGREDNQPTRATGELRKANYVAEPGAAPGSASPSGTLSDKSRSRASANTVYALSSSRV